MGVSKAILGPMADIETSGGGFAAGAAAAASGGCWAERIVVPARKSEKVEISVAVIVLILIPAFTMADIQTKKSRISLKNFNDKFFPRNWI